MVDFKRALDQIYKEIKKPDTGIYYESPINIPPFRASIKDGYAVRTAGGKGRKVVIGYISAGDKVLTHTFKDNEVYKINTGAPVPNHADCIIQVEDTKLLETENGLEKCVEILVEPQENLDIRYVN
jgi:gephyrin